MSVSDTKTHTPAPSSKDSTRGPDLSSPGSESQVGPGGSRVDWPGSSPVSQHDTCALTFCHTPAPFRMRELRLEPVFPTMTYSLPPQVKREQFRPPPPALPSPAASHGTPPRCLRMAEVSQLAPSRGGEECSPPGGPMPQSNTGHRAPRSTLPPCERQAEVWGGGDLVAATIFAPFLSTLGTWPWDTSPAASSCLVCGEVRQARVSQACRGPRGPAERAAN